MLLQSAAMVANKWLVDDRSENIVWYNIYFLEKRLLSIFKFCAWSNLLFFLRAADWPTANFLGVYCYFPKTRLANVV